jgi:DNA-binding beta-propeller fold protein YncE
VIYVGNNWAGTAHVIDARTFRRVGRINVVPDYAQRMAEIRSNPERLAYYLAIRQAIGEGHDQLVDDMFSTPDGTVLAVSRPSFADVVGINLRNRKIIWRFAMHGQRSDHMAVNPRGTRLLVSDSTAGHVDELSLRTGRMLRQFPSGETPHESNYSKNGSRIFHASIGRIYTPTDPSLTCPQPDPSKGDQRFQIVSNKSFKILRQWDIGKKLAEAGFSCMASAVRPMAISPDERTAYLQISFFHGYVVFDLVHGRVRRVVRLPQSAQARQTPRAQYVLNSAHHGLAISRSGRRLCVAGTMDDYVGLVNVAHPQRRKIFPLGRTGARPYWATNGPGGGRCWVSIAGTDRVHVYSYATRKRVASLVVGDHPQRVRPGHVSRTAVRAWRSGRSPFIAPQTG